MDSKSVFNATVCILGVFILLLHIVQVLIKKERRKDENVLLVFYIFTALHFLTYFSYTFLKQSNISNSLTIGFYTAFFIMNNMEALLFYFYLCSYTDNKSKFKKIVDIINIICFTAFVITDIVNIFTHMYFTSVDGVYTRMKYMFLAQIYQFIILGLSTVLVILDKNLIIREKIAFSLYAILPGIAIIIQNAMPGYAIAYTALLLAIEILTFFLISEKNLRIKEEEKLLEQTRIKMLVSQIQPHFVYNTLSSISTLIPLNPSKAQKALDEFTEYLRVNFSSLTETRLVPFEDELKHIQAYVSLEKMRFNDRLNVTYDIKVTNFNVPTLSIQPFVENAIKHGVLKRIEGGTVNIKTYEDDKYIYVEISDDGVGFNINEVNFTNNKHIGLNNIYQRIGIMCKGEVNIQSEVNKGTKVVIKFNK